jgi:hypothetical protein
MTHLKGSRDSVARRLVDEMADRVQAWLENHPDATVVEALNDLGERHPYLRDEVGKEMKHRDYMRVAKEVVAATAENPRLTEDEALAQRDVRTKTDVARVKAKIRQIGQDMARPKPQAKVVALRPELPEWEALKEQVSAVVPTAAPAAGQMVETITNRANKRLTREVSDDLRGSVQRMVGECGNKVRQLLQKDEMNDKIIQELRRDKERLLAALPNAPPPSSPPALAAE